MNKENNFSIRARDLLNRPVHLKVEVKRNFIVEFDQSDNILTVYFSPTSGTPNSLQNLFNEVLCRLSIGKKLEKVAKTSFREMENFLRDENHLPAFDVDASELAAIEKSFILAKFAFLSACFVAGTSLNFNLSGPLTEKNAAFSQLINLLNTVFFSNRAFEFVLYDQPVLYLKCPIDSWSSEDLNTFFPALFTELELGEEIKVVAVQ